MCFFLNYQANITDLVKETYGNYFGVRLRHQDKPFALQTCYKTCVKNLLDWRNKKEAKMAFGKPIVWIEGKDHITDCYFCMTNLMVSAFIKTFVVWRSAIKVDGM